MTLPSLYFIIFVIHQIKAFLRSFTAFIPGVFVILCTTAYTSIKMIVSIKCWVNFLKILVDKFVSVFPEDWRFCIFSVFKSMSRLIFGLWQGLVSVSAGTEDIPSYSIYCSVTFNEGAFNFWDKLGSISWKKRS